MRLEKISKYMHFYWIFKVSAHCAKYSLCSRTLKFLHMGYFIIWHILPGIAKKFWRKMYIPSTLIWMSDGNSYILVLILLVCLLKRVWKSHKPGCQTACQIGFLCDHGSACWSSRLWRIGYCVYCRYMPQCYKYISGFCGWRKWCSSASISCWICSPNGGF